MVLDPTYAQIDSNKLGMARSRSDRGSGETDIKSNSNQGKLGKLGASEADNLSVVDQVHMDRRSMFIGMFLGKPLTTCNPWRDLFACF